jgi:hypothetical protein
MAIRSIKKTQRITPSYPLLMQSITGNAIVLFNAPNEAIVLHGNGYRLGEIISDLDLSEYVAYDGIIELMNTID